MSASFFVRMLPILVLEAALARAEFTLEQELMSSYDQVSRALKGPVVTSCDLASAPTPTPTPISTSPQLPRPKVQIRSKNSIFNQVPGFALTFQGPFPDSHYNNETPGTLEYRTFDGQMVQMPIGVSSRGANRAWFCKDLPPFKMVLPKNAPGKVFNRSDRDIKVVTHCVDPPSEEDKQKVFQEYTLYRVLEASGMYSFLVQLVDATYKNSAGRVITRGPAILIENVKDAKKRFYGTQKNPRQPRSGLKGEFELSNWLIENQDYTDPGTSEGKTHNGYGIKNPRDAETASLPYDFDRSMFVMGRDEGSFGNLAYLSELGKTYDGRGLLKLLVRREPQMQAAVTESPMNSANKEKIANRIRTVVGAARRVLKGEEP